MNVVAKLDRALAKVEEIALAIILVSVVVLAATQVLLRNIWDTGIEWGDVSVQNATVLVGFLGAAIATSEGRHLNIDVFSRLLKGRMGVLGRVVIGVFAVTMSLMLTKGGYDTYRANYVPWLESVPDGWTMGKLLAEELAEGSFPQWLSQLMLPFGFALIGFHFLLRLVRDLHSLATGGDWTLEGDPGLSGDALLDYMQSKAAEDEGVGAPARTDEPAHDGEAGDKEGDKEGDKADGEAGDKDGGAS